MRYLVMLAIVVLAIVGLYTLAQADDDSFDVLVFSRTEGYRHASIEAGHAALRAMGEARDFRVDSTEDASVFTEANLKKYEAVVFLNTTGDVLNDEQQVQLTRYVQAGGGFVGIHAAADTEYEWPWYNRLVGAYFDGHPADPNVREGILSVADPDHEATRALPLTWTRTDEWYDFRSLNPDVQVLLTIDEASYRDSVRSEPHPVAWYHEGAGGRAFYTALGHTEESYTEPEFLEHLWGGLDYVAGSRTGPDYSRPNVMPEENRFTKVVYDFNLTEPMELDLLDDGRILFVERRGAVKIHDPAAGETRTIATMDVFSGLEEGLLGVAVDPNYAANHWVYFAYSASDEPEIRIARFVLEGDSLDLASEDILLDVPVQRDECCHVAGSLEFDAQGNLYLSVGDNTNPFASDGFSPIDERTDRSPWDAQKSSANTNDLRGKILRIHPEPDGSYTIPEGNLFPGDSLHRPEIYTMGHRNPFRIAIDPHTGYLYWGEVGPDASEDRPGRGPKGHDEVNQARGPGNFGWPHFVGDNKSYIDYDFATQASGSPFDPAVPVNDSPNNTGARALPPAQPAFIWYPYGPSPEFPLVRTGGRNAMAGPVFHHEDYADSGIRFPAYYDDKLFIYDWIRGWIMAVTMDEAGDFVEMERFMPSTRFNNPMDMLFGPDGAIYMLEYGTGWNMQNMDARLVRIEYNAGNRLPTARLEADRLIGGAPLTVQFSASTSTDPDDEDLSYAWTFGETGAQAQGDSVTHTFTIPGRHTVRLAVTDASGAASTAETDILVGNDPPEVQLVVEGNQSFFWPSQPVAYRVEVTDTEDGSLADGDIRPEQIVVTMDVVEGGTELTMVGQGHQAMLEAAGAVAGQVLIDNSDCNACHQVDTTSLGPSFMQVAERYGGEAQAVDYLAEKIIKGGSGVWGEQAMAAHPQLTEDEARQMVHYILSLGEVGRGGTSLPPSGTFTPAASGPGEQVVVTASYTDQGGQDVGPLTARAMHVLRPARLQAERHDRADATSRVSVSAEQGGPASVVLGNEGAYFAFSDLDLTGIRSFAARVGVTPGSTTGGRLRIRLDEPTGREIGTLEVDPAATGFLDLATTLASNSGVHDVYVVYEAPEGAPDQPVAGIDWVEFLP